MEIEDFYVVWSENGGVPVVKHLDYSSAAREAERLARMHGGLFHVLRRAATCQRVDLTWNMSEAERLDQERQGMPF